MIYSRGTVVDAIWQHFIFIDPAKLAEDRRIQLAYLARYGRQSLLQWDSTPISEVDQWVCAVAELVRRESVTKRLVESD